MPKTREIRGRIRAVTNIQRITKTMQMIATFRFQVAQKRAAAGKPYARQIGEIVGELAQTLAQNSEGELAHPLLRIPAPPAGRELLLVITSNRGLCGGYNANVLRQLAAFRQTRSGIQLDIEMVGKKGAAYCKFNRLEVARFHKEFTDKPTYEQVEALAQGYMNQFMEGHYDAVHVAAMVFHSMGRQTAEVRTILPLQKPGAEAGATPAAKDAKHPQAKALDPGMYDFYPGAAELLAELLPMTVKTTLFQIFNEAVVSEHIARMVAMKSATDAARKMKNLFTRKYNRARQTAITTELMEVIAGAASVT